MSSAEQRPEGRPSPAVEARTVDTGRLRVHYLENGRTEAASVVFLHGNLSSAIFFSDLMLDLGDAYHGIAPDMRGFGKTQCLPIDATRGLRDLAEDLESLLDTLGITTAHLVGWSTGAGVISQFAIEHPQRCRSLTFIAPVSPFGFGATFGIDGKPTSPDFAGSGGGTVDPAFVQQLRLADKDSRSEHSAKSLLRNVFVRPPRVLSREAELIEAVHETRIGTRYYPGDSEQSEHWPGVAPGRWGVLNALSPKYFDTSSISEISPKPPVLWVRGDADVVVSDRSLFDPATNYSDECLPPDTDASAPEPQPMIQQMRGVLERYAAQDGSYTEVVLDDVGHTPFLEEPALFCNHLLTFLERSDASFPGNGDK